MHETLHKSIVFITGAFIGNNCWDEWTLFFESKGYKCIAPAWPYKNAPPEELRNRHPDPDIASNRLDSVTDYFEAAVMGFPEPPIMIGHSLGGLIVQLLLQRGLGAAGIVIHSFPAPGINLLNVPILKLAWETMGVFNPVKKTYMIPFKKWKYSIANGMSCEEQKQSYYKYAVPESKMVIRDAWKCYQKIDFKKSHKPLLFIAGTGDLLISASLNYSNYRKYKTEISICDYREFKDRNHLLFTLQGCREEVEFILSWLQLLK